MSIDVITLIIKVKQLSSSKITRGDGAGAAVYCLRPDRSHGRCLAHNSLLVITSEGNY